VADVPVQTVSLPLMAPGVESGDSTVTGMLDTDVVPQPFEALTVTVPPVTPAVTVMEVVVEAPVHPPGRVQV
jgi:hypothetical protein